RHSAAAGKIMPILIEVNSGREENKNGVFPENLESLLTQIAPFHNVEIQGLMTMGIYNPDQEKMRPFFRETRKLFDTITKKNIPGVKMRYLSMGMSDSYQAAIEEAATIVRIGSKIFGSRY
ncbi:alanine racemase, partial [bacterium]|nr:alanine racemase [bacterium]